MGDGHTWAWGVALLLALTACGTGDPAGPLDSGDPAPPCAPDLGLFADAGCDRVQDGILAFEPAYPLWSDGVSKQRFVSLPAGSTIDTEDPDAWVFPVGTRFWKHFETDTGQRLETRVIEKVADETGTGGWVFETWAWTKDGADVERLTEGRRDVLGTDHDIPAEDACAECHSGGENQHDAVLPQDQLLDLALGFGAIQLNRGGAGATLASLQADGWLSHPIDAATAVPPGDETARAALGYLHANCGACHGGGAPAKDLRMALPVGVARVEDTPTYTGTVHHPTDPNSRSTGLEEMPDVRIAPGDPDGSAVLWRMQQRDDTDAQMPPLATDVVDEAGVAAVRAWIEAL